MLLWHMRASTTCIGTGLSKVPVLLGAITDFNFIVAVLLLAYHPTYYDHLLHYRKHTCWRFRRTTRFLAVAWEQAEPSGVLVTMTPVSVLCQWTFCCPSIAVPAQDRSANQHHEF
jgi:hypothetical protein